MAEHATGKHNSVPLRRCQFLRLWQVELIAVLLYHPLHHLVL